MSDAEINKLAIQKIACEKAIERSPTEMKPRSLFLNLPTFLVSANVKMKFPKKTVVAEINSEIIFEITGVAPNATKPLKIRISMTAPSKPKDENREICFFSKNPPIFNWPKRKAT